MELQPLKHVDREKGSEATMVGQSTMTIGGPTVIYIDGDGTLTGGGLLNVTQDPKNLINFLKFSSLKGRTTSWKKC